MSMFEGEPLKKPIDIDWDQKESADEKKDEEDQKKTSDETLNEP